MWKTASPTALPLAHLANIFAKFNVNPRKAVRKSSANSRIIRRKPSPRYANKRLNWDNVRYYLGMNLVLDIATSLEFWRQQYPLDRRPSPSTVQPPNDCAYNKADVLALCPSWITEETLRPTDGVLHALAFDAGHRRHANKVVTHVWSGQIPAGSFYLRGSNVYIESPEFIFLHAATILELPELIALGDELCGLYSFDDREERGFRKRTRPLLQKARLERYLQQAAGCPGCKLARQALRFIVERSASPMETFDEMTMCLPYRLGGYSLPVPVMNERVDLTDRGSRIARKRTCYLDMGYSAVFLDIEHHGKYDHSTAEEIDADRARVNGLKEMGFEVIELTADQVGDPIAYEYIIQRIAKRLGKRLRNDALGKTEARMALRKCLYAWNKRSGRVR